MNQTHGSGRMSFAPGARTRLREVEPSSARVIARVAALSMALALTLATASAAPAAAAEVKFHGLLDLVATGRGPEFQINVLTRGDSPLDPVSTRLFAESQVNARTEVFAQVVVNDASGLYLDGAYLMFTPDPQRDLHVLAGKIPWAIGTWGPRTYSNKNPLVGMPLMYAYHTSLLWGDLPLSADALLAAAGTGNYGAGYSGVAGGFGMPFVDDSYWDVGITLTGSQRPFEYALGVTAGAPGWASVGMDDNPGKTVLGRVGIAPLPGLRLGVSGAQGPYLGAWLDSQLPKGKTVDDYDQRVAIEIDEAVGHIELRAEGARNFWESPYAGTLASTGGYVEAKVVTPWGTYVAARYDRLNFSEIAGTTGEPRPWDDDVNRIETGIGYRLSRDVTGKLVYQHTRLAHEATDAYSTLELFAAQLSIGF